MPFSIRLCRTSEINTNTDPRMVRTTAICFQCWVQRILHTQELFLVSLNESTSLLVLTVLALTIQPGALPDEGLIFDSIFARQKFTPSPNKVSTIFFDWASLIIHGKLPMQRKRLVLTAGQTCFRPIIVTSASLKPRPILIFPLCMETCRKIKTI